jgi:hypothetical protein
MKPQLAIRYFQSWTNKDIATLDLLMADNVVVTDWDGQAVGKQEVLKFNKTLFDKFESLNVDIIKIAIGQDTVMAEIRVIVNNKDVVNVVDVIDYDQDDKIKSIRAYKR